MRSGQGVTPKAKRVQGYRDSKNIMCDAGTCYLDHIQMSCEYFGERTSRDDIVKMEERSVRGDECRCRYGMKELVTSLLHRHSFHRHRL